ncbi:hypothetical protein [Pseudonocardia sp.]|uniref:hypothetical protein n=1 Tax=Pseudonocardia sp. TaxID=60912 RepID=UPI002634D76D|nr:hypothetical protein [Pseudonocardia sp.]
MVAHGASVTMQDIAQLARVQRHVVSMWRSRPTVRGERIPFPEPVPSTDGVLRFDRDEVVDYLATTRRGNNTDARYDAPGVSAPDGLAIEDVVVLLCLHALTGDELEGRSAAELVAAAERVDAGDRVMLRELRAMRPTAEMLRYVDDLVEASFGLSDALNRLQAGPLSRVAAGAGGGGAAGVGLSQPERGLDDEAIELVRAVVEAARLSLDADVVALDPPADLVLARRLAGGFAGIVLGDDVDRRRQRRRALLDGVDVVEGSPSTVRVRSVVGASEQAALEAVDELTVTLAPTEVGVVIGSAAVMCDPLPGPGERDRAHTLRPGNLAMAMRLPRGLWKGAHRQSLGMWVLRGGGSASTLWLADLDTETVERDDLANDVLAALRGTERRAYRYARRDVLTRVLGGGAVVPRGARAARFAVVEGGARLDRIYAASLTTGETIAGFDVTATSASTGMVVRRRSLAELRDTGQLVVRRGSRIDAGHTDPAGTVPVLSADGSTDTLFLDPFDADQHYRRAHRTEPGDVIVLDGRRPVARVDPRGGALVASPSRILRLTPTAPVGPHALAAIVNDIAPPGSEWPTWSVPELPPAECGLLDAALAGAAAHKEVLRRHEQALRDLVTNLIHGVAAGAVTLDPTLIDTGAG